jgi:hypothetical protein
VDPAELLIRLAEALDAEGILYFVTGSVATIFYGEPRLTNEIDVVVALDPARIRALARRFTPPDFYFEPESALHALSSGGRFNVIQPATGLKIDFMIPAGGPFDQARFSGSRRLAIGPDASATFAAPEHVILKKLRYYVDGGSDKHLRDIAGILRVSGSSIDRGEIDRWADELGVAEVWRQIREREDPPAHG